MFFVLYILLCTSTPVTSLETVSHFFFCPQSNSTVWACFYGFWNTHLSVLGIFWESQFQNLFLFNAGNSRMIVFLVRNFSSNRVWGFCEKPSSNFLYVQCWFKKKIKFWESHLIVWGILWETQFRFSFMFNAGLIKRSIFRIRLVDFVRNPVPIFIYVQWKLWFF